MAVILVAAAALAAALLVSDQEETGKFDSQKRIWKGQRHADADDNHRRKRAEGSYGS